MVASFLVSPPPALPPHCPLSTYSRGDPIITAVRSHHSPVLPCMLGIKHQLLSTAWPTLLLRPHLPPLSSGSPCFHRTGLLTVPPPSTGHTSTSGPLQILFPVPGTLPADTYMVHSLTQVSAQRSPPQGDPDEITTPTCLPHCFIFLSRTYHYLAYSSFPCKLRLPTSCTWLNERISDYKVPGTRDYILFRTGSGFEIFSAPCYFEGKETKSRGREELVKTTQWV